MLTYFLVIVAAFFNAVTEPKTSNNAFRRTSPKPGISSNKDSNIIFDLLLRWNVMANLCASSLIL